MATEHGWIPESLDALPEGTVMRCTYSQHWPGGKEILEAKIGSSDRLPWVNGDDAATTSSEIAMEAVTIEPFAVPLAALRALPVLENIAYFVECRADDFTSADARELIEAMLDAIPGFGGPIEEAPCTP